MRCCMGTNQQDEKDEERMVRLEMEALAAEEKARTQAVSSSSS